ncbi:TIGR02265 family protein [Archangium sp.]|uniref:TIGR02265 family protein n=1 Tax=Archangium sp. TaxID=1872627 RepID=UPI002D2CF60A|nr:TIGR02265 family protein [Archangium sp.]HYO55316.1 TIGR02265 family protein [Archangium sp.]
METPAITQPLQLGTEEELKWRLSLLSPDDLLRGLFHNSLMELVRRLEGDDAVRQCLEVCGEARFLDFFNYAHHTYIKLLYAAAWRLSERFGNFEKSMWEIGYEGSKTFYASAAGKVLILMAQGDPRRLLSNIPTSMQTASKHVECKVTLTGPKSGILVKHEVMPRPHTEGGLQAMCEVAKVKGAKVRSRSLSPTDNEYEVTWD